MSLELTAAQAEIITQMNAGIYHPCAPDRKTILEVKRRVDAGQTNRQIQIDVYVGWRIISKVRQGGYII
ncbi:MAG: hypothetical protein E4G94_09070 [ANME-2 cluster archaeon]|nr:MAG: hypothetical protein E4G94_09070 [ANME-2 cluster archaeon]